MSEKHTACPDCGFPGIARPGRTEAYCVHRFAVPFAVAPSARRRLYDLHPGGRR